MVPAVDDRLLPDTAAARAENTWLYSGAVVGINEPRALLTLTSAAIGKVFRIPNNLIDSEHLDDSTWMQFEDINTDVLKSAVVGDTFERYYIASPTTEPKYNTRARIENGDPSWLLGLPAPIVAPVINIVGGASGTNRTSAYVYTWVTEYGEEGPPSTPTLATGKIDASWNLTLNSPVPGDLGVDRNITDVRIYRTVTSASGVATYFLVAEQDVAITTYSDTQSDTTVSQNNTLESTNWTAPPSDLQGWVSMPNGIVAGFRENEIWFSEPYRPHAWPAQYALAVDYPVVGLGVVGQALVVCTENHPYQITGIHPATMSQSRMATLEPCLSRGSILSAPEGVYYCSANGLVLVANGQAQNITRGLITKDQWQKVVGVTTIATLRAARLAGAYYAFGSARFGVFEEDAFDVELDINGDGASFEAEDFTGAFIGFLVDPTNERVAFNALTTTLPTVNVQNDPWTGELFLIRDGILYWVDIAEEEPTYEAFKWRSKIYQTGKVDNFAAAKLFFEVSSTAPVLNPVRNTDLVQTLAADQYGLFRVYADSRLIMTRELRTSGELMRLPSGFKASYWQFEIESRVRVLSFQVATSVKELQGV